MKKTLTMFLVVTALSVPVIKSIDCYSESNSKLLVIDDSVNTFNTEYIYKIEC